MGGRGGSLSCRQAGAVKGFGPGGGGGGRVPGVRMRRRDELLGRWRVDRGEKGSKANARRPRVVQAGPRWMGHSADPERSALALQRPWRARWAEALCPSEGFPGSAPWHRSRRYKSHHSPRDRTPLPKGHSVTAPHWDRSGALQTASCFLTP